MAAERLHYQPLRMPSEGIQTSKTQTRLSRPIKRVLSVGGYPTRSAENLQEPLSAKTSVGAGSYLERERDTTTIKAESRLLRSEFWLSRLMQICFG